MSCDAIPFLQVILNHSLPSISFASGGDGVSCSLPNTRQRHVLWTTLWVLSVRKME